MLSQISFLLAFALVASGSQLLHGNWRYEGQFTVGNPKLNWEKSGWKLVVPFLTIKVHSSSSVKVELYDSYFKSLNDHLPERATWTHMNKMDWLNTVVTHLEKPFEVRFNGSDIKELVFNENDTKESIDIKIALADHIRAGLLKKEGIHKTRSLMGVCDSKTNVTFKKALNDSHRIYGKAVTTTYYHACENFRYPVIGIIPKRQVCWDCEEPKLKLPLNSYTKAEVSWDKDIVMSILRQNVIALPILQADSPAYSIYGNMSLIRVNYPVPIRKRLTNESKEKVVVPIEKASRPYHYDRLSSKDIEPYKDIEEALKLIRAILSENGKLKRAENVFALHDLLSSKSDLILSLEKYLTSNEERNLFYSFITSQESEHALEVLFNATKHGRISYYAMPLYMVLTSKITESKNYLPILDFIKNNFEKCPLCSEISMLALTTIIRRNSYPMKMRIMENKWERLSLSMNGNLGVDVKEEIPARDVLKKMAYVTSKRIPQAKYFESVIDEVLKIFWSEEEATIVRVEAFKVLMGLTCNKTIWDSLFSQLNAINDPVLLNYVMSYMKSFSSNKLPFYKYMTKRVQEHWPLLKAKRSEGFESLLSKHFVLSAYDTLSNMGFSVLADYVIPRTNDKKFMTASIDIQPYVMNTLFSWMKIQVIVPLKEVVPILKSARSLNYSKLKSSKEALIQEIWKWTENITKVIKGSELKIFNNDMEVAYINNKTKIADSHGKWPRWNLGNRIRGMVLPVAIKKYIHSLVGPHVEMSIVKHLCFDTIFEMVNNMSLSIIPKWYVGLRLRLQADDKVTINTGTQIEAKIEARNITWSIEKNETSLRLKSFWALQIEPVWSLRVIPTTGSRLGSPARIWEKQSAPSMRVKSIPINWVAALDDPAVFMNISGKIQKPLNKNWWYAIQEPQLLELAILPSYELPADVVVTEMVFSLNQCQPTEYCILKEQKILIPTRWCQRICINAMGTEEYINSEGSTLTWFEKKINGSRGLHIDSRIKLSNNSKLGIFKANTIMHLPPWVTPRDLLNNSYINELQGHKFIRVPSLQMTMNETELTRQEKDILSGLSLPINRDEDYTDMNRNILNLYPRLYINDTLGIKNLHKIFKNLLNMSTIAIAARTQKYNPNWQMLRKLRGELITILKEPLISDEPNLVVMRDHVIIWCVMKYYEVGLDYKAACSDCEVSKDFVKDFKEVVFPAWVNFHTQSKSVVKEALQKSSNNQLNFFIEKIFYTDDILIKIVKASSPDELDILYKTLLTNLRGLIEDIEKFNFRQLLVSKTVMVKAVAFELLKSLAVDSHHIERESTKINTYITDLSVSFMSVSARFIMQSSSLLNPTSVTEQLGLSVLIKQAITLVDYTRLLRAVVIDPSVLPDLKAATYRLWVKTNQSFIILKNLPSSITLDPMVQIFIIEVMALHKITVLELKRVPKYALFEVQAIDTNEYEWDLIQLMKNLSLSYRSWSTLKRGLLKYPESKVWLRDSSAIDWRALKWNISVEWEHTKLKWAMVAKKSDSQVVRELQESTLTKTKEMEMSLNKILYYNTTGLNDTLLWELNIYRDIASWVSVEGRIPKEISSWMKIMNEKIKTYLLPFEASLTEQDNLGVKSECPAEHCIRAVISRDCRKVDVLWREPKENMLWLQLPTLPY